MIKTWIDKLFGNEITLREKLFRIILMMGIVAMFLAIVANIALGQSVSILLPLLAGMLILVLSLWISCYFKKMELSATILVVGVNWIMFPIIFFTSGGIESGSTVWFVLGIIFVFLLFSGKKLLFILAVTLLDFAVTYVYAYIHPEAVVPMASAKDISFDSALAVCLVSVTIGILIKFQNKVYEKERRISEKQKKELEEINRSKSTFFANMSHEIRTPLNTIIGLNEMTLREDVPDEVTENSIHIQNASKILLALINDILDLSKIESGNMEIIPTQYETGTLFSDLVNLIWVKAHEKKLEFRVDIDENIPSLLYGDAVRIRQVLINILTNAVKYTKEGSVTLSSKCRKKAANLVELKISVADTGMGIRKESMSELFSSFKRIDEKKNKNIEGTGLGLSISKQLIDMMGGKIEVDSIYTKGSTFTVTLEQQIIDEKPMGMIDFSLKKNISMRPKYKQSFEAPEGQILIVDDNEMNCLVAKKLLRDTKVKIDTAVSGYECLELTQQKYYHVIFMDHKMPDMDGVETLRKVQEQENGLCKKTPVIALTANVMNEAEQTYKNLGFDGYLPKPINGSLFESALLKFLPADVIEYSIDSEEKGENAAVELVRKRQKRPIQIIADGVCDLPTDIIKQLDIEVLYYYIETGDGNFRDVEEISSNNLMNYIEDKNNKAFSHCPSEQEYESVYASALECAEQVIHITIARNVDPESYDIAKSVATGFDHVFVFDSEHLSSGMGLMVMTAAKMAREHKSVEEIFTVLEEMKKRVDTSFVVPNLHTLNNCGLAGNGMTKLCDMLDCHPVLHMKRGKITCQNIVIGDMGISYKTYIKKRLRNPQSIDKRVVFITYTGCSIQQVHEFADEVQKHVKFERVILQQASATISCNCGLGTMGVLFARK